MDPYRTLGIARTASTEDIRVAYRRLAKSRHPDAGGGAEEFNRLRQAGDLLLDPARRKFFDATGYDPDNADPLDLQGLLLIESLVNDIVLDDREPGTFDPVARMRDRIAADIRKARFEARELESHRERIGRHLARLAARPENDILGHMLQARMEAISISIDETLRRAGAAERAQSMLDAYRYAVDQDGKKA